MTIVDKQVAANLPRKRVQIVSYGRGWILEEMARRLCSSLRSENLDVELVFTRPVDGADVYIHFIYIQAVLVPGAANWVCVTHVDQWWKMLRIVRLSQLCDGFIVMSDETAGRVRKYVGGVPVVVMRPESIHFESRNSPTAASTTTFGIFTNLYADKRKEDREIRSFLQLCSQPNSGARVIVYGDGWEAVVSSQSVPGSIEVVNGPFNKIVYERLLRRCDYVVYFGMDEGAYSVLDASLLGIPVITTAQGFHLDLSFPQGSILVKDPSEVSMVVGGLLRAAGRKRAINVDLAAILDVKLRRRHLSYPGFAARVLGACLIRDSALSRARQAFRPAVKEILWVDSVHM